MEDTQFKSEKVSRTASFIVNGKIAVVFPLFGAFEERKWATGWSPVLVYPDREVIAEGTTFTTAGKGEEATYLWRVILYDPQRYRIRYLVSTENRYWTIDVMCASNEPASRTTVCVTYTYIGLNLKGNTFNRRDLAVMYTDNLCDWADAINGFLVTE